MLDPIAFQIFGLKVYWYGITYVIGFIFAYFFIMYYSKYLSINRDKIEDIFFYTMIFSVIGARFFEIIFYNPIYYFSNPLSIFAVWEGGMSIHGGFAGAFLTLLYFSKKYKINLLKLTDLFVIPTALALAFGRLANFVNQEVVGKPTTSEIGVTFPLYDGQKRWPTQIFESMKNMIIFQILLFTYIFKKLKPGIITALFLILYNFTRFFIEFLKEPTLNLGLISISQLLTIIFGIAGIWLFIKIKS